MRVVDLNTEGFRPVGSYWTDFIGKLLSGQQKVGEEILEPGNDGDTKYLTMVSSTGTISQHQAFIPNEAAQGWLRPTEKAVDILFKAIDGCTQVRVLVNGQVSRDPIFEMSTVLQRLEKWTKSGSNNGQASVA